MNLRNRWTTALVALAALTASCTGSITPGADASDVAVDNRPVDTGIDTGIDATTCSATETLCGDACTDVRTNALNCGSCGHACGSTEACVAGVCVLNCPAGQQACGAQCVTLSADVMHCGACETACGAGQVCSAGVCANSCGAGLVDCNGSCRSIQNDPTACGACANQCASGPNSSAVCAAGQCGVRCATGFGDCDATATNGCETTLDSVTNCGGCGITCSFANASATCGATGCAFGACNAGYADCDSNAANGCEARTDSDRANCGACGNACGAGQVCSNGACATSCTPGLTECNGACHDLTTDPSACGACNTVCAAGAGATAFCASGACGVRCAAGLGNCDGDATNGCETALDTTANCGGCGVACSFANASATCGANGCAFGACSAGHADCDGTTVNGCEVNTQSDLANCGACGNACAAGQVCSNGACAATCMTGLTNCSNSCRNVQTDPSACGDCATQCPSGPHASPLCGAGSCSIVCATGFGNCDGNATTGCETALDSISNCGGCGIACSYANASATCGATGCAFGACNAGFADCDNNAANGCEANTLGDRNNCGACGNACAAGQVCSSGACTATCMTGLTNCSNSCRNLQTDPSACGDCATQCPSGPNGASICSAGTCGITCSAGFGNCDGTASNGCETALNTATNCHGCGVVCSFANASGTCGASGCAFGACNAGYASCDGNAANGCEVNTQNDRNNCGGCGTVCGNGQVCSNGACVATCMTGLTNCSNTCRNLQTDPSSCGACGTVCPSGPNATPYCSVATCGITCAAGFGNCDGNSANGCEAALNTVANCRGCGVACSFANAGATCAVTGCAIGTCNAGFANCDNNASNGCEVSTLSDRNNCGACGNACGAGQVCSNGACTTSCGSGLTACNNACTSLTFDPSNCGACNNVCPARANAAAVCAASACSFACSSGFANCDNNAANGCEVDTRSNANNCGACGVVCPSGQFCSSGACTAAVHYGYDVEFSAPSGHSPNYLLGSRINVPVARTLRALAIIAKAAGPRYQMALYTENGAGHPGVLVAQVSGTLVAGRQEIAVTPVALPAGNYWFMVVYETSASVGFDSNTSEEVDYISFPYGAGLPTTFPSPQVYTGQRFNYYIVAN